VGLAPSEGIRYQVQGAEVASSSSDDAHDHENGRFTQIDLLRNIIPAQLSAVPVGSTTLV